jgi:hypothetical protein
MLLAIIKYIDEYEIKGEGCLADNAGYYAPYVRLHPYPFWLNLKYKINVA